MSGFWHFPLIEVDSLSENLGQLSLLDEKEQAESNLEILSFEQDYDLVIDWQRELIPWSSMSFRTASGRFNFGTDW